MVYFEAPPLCQAADTDLLATFGAEIFPGFVHRKPGENGLRLGVNGSATDPAAEALAAERFQILLGVVRSWNALAGQRADELTTAIGPGAIRDEDGNQTVRVGVARHYQDTELEVVGYAQCAKRACEGSEHVRNALWLNGRRDRNAADFYMIYEYAKKEFGKDAAIVAALSITGNDLTRLRSSANNLAPREGGRHANGSGPVTWPLDQQKEFVAKFVKAWVTYSGAAST